MRALVVRFGLVVTLCLAVGAYQWSAPGVRAESAADRGGTVLGWGLNISTESGQPERLQVVDAPMYVDGLDQIVAVAAGWDHSLALRGNGTVLAWGEGIAGRLGTDSHDRSEVPRPVLGLPSASFVAAGSRTSFAIGRDGSLWAWGRNDGGELGDGSLTDRERPVPVLDQTTTVAASFHNALAVRRDGSVWAWGPNTDGELGDGSTTPSQTPQQIAGISGAVAVAVGEHHALALMSDGTVAAWGSNAHGELGDGSIMSRLVPGPVLGLDHVVAIAAGSDHSLALRVDGSMWAWGRFVNPSDRSVTNRRFARPVDGVDSVVAIAAGQSFSVALRDDGSVWRWNYGSPPDRFILVPTIADAIPARVEGVDRVTSISASHGHILAVRDGPVHDRRRLTDSSVQSPMVPPPPLAMAPPPIQPQAGTLWSWGGPRNLVVPETVATAPNVLTAAFGKEGGVPHWLGLTADGSVIASGRNFYGELGDGSRTSSDSPVSVSNLDDVVAIGAGPYRSLALRGDGTVWAWGQWRRSGALEAACGGVVPDFACDPLPVRVDGLTDVVAIASGTVIDLAVSRDGTVWTWTPAQPMPKAIAGLPPIVAVSDFGLADTFTHIASTPTEDPVALAADGSVWSWKINYAEMTVSAPARVTGLPRATAIAAGVGFGVALAWDGTVWSWGENVAGQLGDGTGELSAGPVQASGENGLGVLDNIVAIAAGESHTLALRSDGSVWSWGFGGFFRDGLPPCTHREGQPCSLVPAQVPGLAHVTAISAANGASLAVTEP